VHPKQSIMFTNKKEMTKENEISGAVNIIGVGTVITGDIQSKGDIRIDGILKGAVKTAGKVVVGQAGTIEGDIECKNADIAGSLNAKITVAQLLSLKATAKLTGDLITNKLAIEPGAAFTGHCSMGAVIKDIKHVEKTEAKEKTA
jgi:cytoskeletal protein CcmA (bactofilin family)